MVEVTFTNEYGEVFIIEFNTIEEAMNFLSLQPDKSYTAKLDIKGDDNNGII